MAWEAKDVAATVLSSLSLLVSVITASLGALFWWSDRRDKRRAEGLRAAEHRLAEQAKAEDKRLAEQAKVEERISAIKDAYRLSDIALNVREVADVYKFHRGQEHLLWQMLHDGHPQIPTIGGVMTRRELLQHMSRVDSYWDQITNLDWNGNLPGFFHRDGGWLARAENYRCLFEPLYIANYYQMNNPAQGGLPYLQLGDDGSPLKRPKRYWHIQHLWAQMQPELPQHDTLGWAIAFEQLREAGAMISMQGIPPVVPPVI